MNGPIKRLRGRVERRRQAESFRVLTTFRPGSRHYGLDLWRESGLRTGRLYPALTRLESVGLIASGWDAGPTPRRRHYWLTEVGAAVVQR